MLEVRLIGTFDIRCDGKSVTISSRAAQSLFAYLILTAGNLHRREKLAGMFWPDASEEKARAYLRHEIWQIRKALSYKPKVEYLLADDLTIVFDQSADYWLDVAALKNVNGNASADQLMSALSFYQDELLPGFYEDWVVLEREHLQVVYEQKMSRLLELLESEKRWPEILDWAERWISFGQAPEIAYRALMSAYDALGDRAKLASTYQRCVQALRELNLEPSEQTRALAFNRASSLNIPIPLTSFVGREKELKELLGLFSKSRFITLTGSGGVGKTRLAIQVVAEVLGMFPDGVWFLDLAPLSDPALVPNTLANLLGLRESGDTKLSVTDLLINYFRSRTTLVIFDNCEHLIESSAQLVNSLLTSCENLSILATSREALRVSGEISYRVPSLEIPRPGIEPAIDVLAKIESVRLFTERAEVASPGFAIRPQNARVIAKICQRLDGIPLAIELAATRANMLTVEQILKRLDDRFNFLTRGLRTALPRHQTLRATIEWSYDLLSETERQLFNRLSVFAGGWTLEAAEAVRGQDELKRSNILDLLGRLVDKSLVLVELTSASGETRYRMLETIREYALEKLTSSGEADAVQWRHAEYYLAQAEASESVSNSIPPALLERLETEYDNLRAALEWSQQAADSAELGLLLAGALRGFWVNRGYWSEARGWLEGALARPEAIEYPRALAKVLWSLGGKLALQGEYIAGQTYMVRSLTLLQELGDIQQSAWVIHYLGWLAREHGDATTARLRLEEGLTLFRELGDKAGIAGALVTLGEVAVMQEDTIWATTLLEESLVIYNEQEDKEGVGWALNHLGHVAQLQGDYGRAAQLHEESLPLFRELGVQLGVTWAHQSLGETALAQGDMAVATTHFVEALILFRDLGDRMGMAWCLAGLAGVAALHEEPERAAWLWGAAEALRQSIGAREAPAACTTHERLMSEVRKQLGEVEFNAKWAEGQAASMEQAIAEALTL